MTTDQKKALAGTSKNLFVSTCQVNGGINAQFNQNDNWADSYFAAVVCKKFNDEDIAADIVSSSGKRSAGLLAYRPVHSPGQAYPQVERFLSRINTTLLAV